MLPPWRMQDGTILFYSLFRGRGCLPPIHSDFMPSLTALSVRLRSSRGFLKSSSTCFFLQFLHPPDFFRLYPRAVLPVKCLAMNSGCASAL